jgi:chromosomal replication initiator protein
MQTTPKELKLKSHELIKLRAQIKELRNNLKKNKDQVIKTAIMGVCKDYKITFEDMMSGSRKRVIVLPRMVLMYKLYQTGFTLTEVGAIFNRDHTTVINAIRKIEAQKDLYDDIIL